MRGTTTGHSGIAVGDLVQVVQPPYCRHGDPAHGLGHIFRVGGFDLAGRHRCGYCGKRHDGNLPVAMDTTRAFVKGAAWWDLRRLRRIPPLDELERLEEGERVRQPEGLTCLTCFLER